MLKKLSCARMRTILVACAALGTVACGGGTGSAKVEGEISGLVFAFETIYAWVDAKDTEMGTNGTEMYKDSEHPTLNIVLTGAAFDPEQDLRFMSAIDLCEMTREATVNGNILVAVSKFEKVSTGQTLNKPATAETTADAPKLEVETNPGVEELPTDAKFPSEPRRLGSKRTSKLTLDKLEGEQGGSIEGKLELKWETAEGEPASVLTGDITVTFTAVVIAERLAEEGHRLPVDCN